MLIDSNDLKAELGRLKAGAVDNKEKGAIEIGFCLGVDGAIEMIRILELFANVKEEINENQN